MTRVAAAWTYRTEKRVRVSGRGPGLLPVATLHANTTRQFPRLRQALKSSRRRLLAVRRGWRLALVDLIDDRSWQTCCGSKQDSLGGGRVGAKEAELIDDEPAALDGSVFAVDNRTMR